MQSAHATILNYMHAGAISDCQTRKSLSAEGLTFHVCLRSHVRWTIIGKGRASSYEEACRIALAKLRETVVRECNACLDLVKPIERVKGENYLGLAPIVIAYWSEGHRGAALLTRTKKLLVRSTHYHLIQKSKVVASIKALSEKMDAFELGTIS